jgi:uncharacterized protein YdiU (UPF0061 family)
MEPLRISFDNTYARDLPGLSVRHQPTPVPAPRVIRFNRSLAAELGLDVDAVQARAAEIFSGNELPEGADPVAQAYAGHQFGGFSPQLGDGRALLLGEVVDRHGRRCDIALKGSGRTPFSRGGDGKAALGPMLREHILGEAMFALGIPTTRSLAVIATGEPVYRDQALPGAVLARVAASHVRVGTFQYFAARQDEAKVKTLADYVIARHEPQLLGHPEPYRALLEAVARRQADLIAAWMNAGFIHGVMNTDNMAISGETIDYGPCAFMEAFDRDAVFSSIDRQGRYAYSNQPTVAVWNIARFAETLLSLLDEDEQRAIAAATEVIHGFSVWFEQAWLRGARTKLGLTTEDSADAALAQGWLSLLEVQAVDYTLAWRFLGEAATGDDARLLALFGDQAPVQAWLQAWRSRCATEPCSPAERRAAMDAVNPVYIPRNHLVEEALAAATRGDLGPLDRLCEAVAQPYQEREAWSDLMAPAPLAFTQRYQTFCGT